MNSKYNIKFNGLHINDNGQLIGDEKDTVKSYIINISARKIKDDNKQEFDIIFSEYDQDDKDERLSFKSGDNDVTSYFLADNRLHLKSTQRGGKLKDYSVLLCEMSIPLKPKCKIKSIKRSMSFLQIKTQTDKKTRICYINPGHISNIKISVKKVSHKPQQSFPSRLGNDPHEIYHASLPFTSDRKANFSSKNIPFVSSVVDNFRVHVKLAKEMAAENKNKDAILHCAKAIDPGITGVCSALSGLARSTQQKIYTNLKNNNDLYYYNISITKSRGTSLSNLVSDSLGTHFSLNNISEELLSLTKKINPNESIQLNSTNRIAGFFGIASGGIPFISGWFTCILAELCDNYNLNIFKTETGNIRLSFHHLYKTSGTALVDIGQGLERQCVKLGVLDFMSVMPAEANLIMSIYCMSGNNFSFELSEENYEKFVTQLTKPKLLKLKIKNW